MGRKQKEEKAKLTLHISRELYEKIEEIIARRMLAKKGRITKSEIVERALRKCLDEKEFEE